MSEFDARVFDLIGWDDTTDSTDITSNKPIWSRSYFVTNARFTFLIGKMHFAVDTKKIEISPPPSVPLRSAAVCVTLYLIISSCPALTWTECLLLLLTAKFVASSRRW